MGEICGHIKSKACLGTYGPRVAVQSPEMAAYLGPQNIKECFCWQSPCG